MSSGSRLFRCLRSFTCQHYTELASKALDRPLSLSERLSFKLHHVICMVCRRYNRQLNLIHRASNDIAQEETDQIPLDHLKLSNEAKQRLIKAVETPKKQ